MSERKGDKKSSIRNQLIGMCAHFNGMGTGDDDKHCEAGISYRELANVAEYGTVGCWCRLPCTGNTPGSEVRGYTVVLCDQYRPFTDEEIDDQVREWDRVMDCMQRKVSQCCEAPLDESRVIPDGPHKGHGGRYCSQCGKLAFWV